MGCWVLLRGLTRERAHWGGFPAALRDALPAAEVLAIDLPGAGELNVQPSPTSMPAIVAACRAQLAARSVAPPYRLLALSLGAMAAIAWAEAAPDELAACVLVNTSVRPFCPFWRRLRPRAWAPVAWRLAAGGSDRAWESTVLRLTSRREDPQQRVLGAWTAIRRARPVSRANTLRQLLAAARFRAPRAPPPVPMLVLASRADGLVDPCCSRALAFHWRLPIVEHPSAGHDLPLDDPGWVVGHVARWALARGVA